MSTSAQSPVDITRDVMSRVPAGVAVLTLSDDDGLPHGMTISSLTPVSADPPSVLVCVGAAASMHPFLVEGRDLCINLLRPSQVGHSVGFAYGEKLPFEVFGWSQGGNGAPLLDEVAGHLLGRVDRVVPHHQTAVVFIEVTGGSIEVDETLVYWQQKYFGEMSPVSPDVKGRW